MTTEIKFESAEPFLVEAPSAWRKEYEFPFVALDPTPGGRNLGRVMFILELIPSKRKREGRYFYEKILLQVRQTYDPKYRGKTFEIPCFTEALNASVLRREDSYISHVWRIEQCPEHKAVTLQAYPKNHHTKLKISVGSSIMVDAIFE